MSNLLLMQLNAIPRQTKFDPVSWLVGFWPALAAVGALLVVGWLLLRWLSGILGDSDSTDSDREMWNAMEGLKEDGELTEAEVRLIRGRLAARLGDAGIAGSRTGKSAETARFGSGIRRNELHATPSGSGENCLESQSESVQSAQTSKPTKIRGSALNPGEVSEEP